MKTKSLKFRSVESLESKIYLIRGHKVMLDTDLANLYGVPTKVLNQAVRRNIKRFPEDFMYQLSIEEAQSRWSQIGLGLNNSVENFSVAGNDRSQPDERCSPTQKRLGIGSTARST